MSEEERERLIRKSNIENEVEYEFENTRRNINITDAKYGSLQIEHMKTVWGKREFKKRKNFIISEHGELIGLYKEPWWECLYRTMINEEVTIRLNENNNTVQAEKVGQGLPQVEKEMESPSNAS